MSFQVCLLSGPEKGKVFPIQGTIFQLGAASRAAVSLPDQDLPDIVIQFQVADEGCRGVVRAAGIVSHCETPISKENPSFLWRVGEELLVGKCRLLLETTSAMPRSHGSSALFSVVPPIAPPTTKKTASTSSAGRPKRPEESNATRTILLGILGSVIVGFAILLLVFGLEKRKNTPESYSFRQIYAVAKSEGMPTDFMQMLSEANLNEARNPHHALNHYQYLQRILLAELESRHPSTYDKKGKILNFLNQSIGRMERKIRKQKR